MEGWNREEALGSMRRAYIYLNDYYVEGQEWPEEESEEEQAITRAFEAEDMPAFRDALRAWVKACLRYAHKAKWAKEEAA